MIKNKKALSAMEKFISIVLVLTLLVSAIYFLTDLKIPDFFDILIPEFSQENESSTSITENSSCPIIARVGNFNKVEFCSNEECSERIPVNIEIKDDSILVSEIKVGDVINKEILWINPEVTEKQKIEQNSKTYLRIKDSINLLDLLKVHDTILTGSDRRTICKKKPTPTLEEHRIQNFEVIRKRGIEGKSGVPGPEFYYNTDELIKNKNKIITPFYFDRALTEKALSYVAPNGEVQRIPEANEEKFPPYTKSVNLIPLSKLDFVVFQESHGVRADLTLDGKASDIFKIKIESDYLDNTNNKLGVDSRGDPFTHVQYVKFGGDIYVKFYEYEGLKSETPFILLKYWEAYRSFIWVPEWALAWDKKR